MKKTFFPRQCIPKILSVLLCNYTWDTPYQVWFDLNNSLTQLKRPILKICYSRNSQISLWKTNFFPRQCIPKIFSVLHCNYTWDTPYQVWFDLNNSLTQFKRPNFKIRYSRNSQISIWKINFSPRQAIPKNLSVLPSNYTWDTPYQVWFDLTRWKELF